MKDLLESNGITVELADTVSGFNRVYLGAGIDRSFAIQITGENFKKAEAVLRKDSEAALNAVEDDHYLFQFTDQELREIISKPDEWSSFDLLLAEKILKEKGQSSTADNQDIIKERLSMLSLPNDASEMIVLGYVFALVTESVLGA